MHDTAKNKHTLSVYSEEQGGRQAFLASLTLTHMHTCAGTPRRRLLQAGSLGQRARILATCMVLELAGHSQKRPVDSLAGRPSPNGGWGLKGIGPVCCSKQPHWGWTELTQQLAFWGLQTKIPVYQRMMEVPVLASATPRSPSHLNLGSWPPSRNLLGTFSGAAAYLLNLLFLLLAPEET